jgi:hypothetical protein
MYLANVPIIIMTQNSTNDRRKAKTIYHSWGGSYISIQLGQVGALKFMLELTDQAMNTEYLMVTQPNVILLY